MSVEWKPSGTNAYDAFDRASGEKLGQLQEWT